MGHESYAGIQVLLALMQAEFGAADGDYSVAAVVGVAAVVAAVAEQTDAVDAHRSF